MPSFRNGGLGRAAGGRRSGAPRLAALACTALLSILPVAAEPADSQPFPAMAPRSVDAGGFAGRLLARMRREAQRYGSENVFPSDRRSDEAERIVTRSARRTLDLELERLAQRSLGLGATLDFFRRVSAQGTHPEPLSVHEPPGGGPGSFRQETGRSDRVTGRIGLRLDAHPALVIRTTFFGIQSRLEMPARHEPIRLSIECPFGPRGRAAVTSGVSRDGQGWATLTLHFRF